MYRITILLLFFILLLVSSPYAMAAEVSDFSGVLKSRKVVGVIYFTQNTNKLSKSQQEEAKRIASLVASQNSPDKIVRIEGFSAKNNRRSSASNDSLSIAKSVWYYLSKLELINASNLYLTGFTAAQSISKLQGERVEIAIYDNPFNEKIDIYISN